MNIKSFLSRISAKSATEDMRKAVNNLLFKMEISGIRWRDDADVSNAFDNLADLAKNQGHTHD